MALVRFKATYDFASKRFRDREVEKSTLAITRAFLDGKITRKQMRRSRKSHRAGVVDGGRPTPAIIGAKFHNSRSRPVSGIHERTDVAFVIDDAHHGQDVFR